MEILRLFYNILEFTIGVIVLMLLLDQSKSHEYILQFDYRIYFYCIATYLLFSILLIINKRHAKKILKSFNDKSLEAYPEKSIVGILLNKFNKTTILSQTIMSISIAIILIMEFIFRIKIGYDYMIILLIVLTIIKINENLIIYRIRKNYYGMNRHEIIEIVEFIKENSNKIDFMDKGNPKDLFDDNDAECSLLKEQLTNIIGAES